MDASRRGFLESTAGLVTLTALGGCEWLERLIRERPVRRDISTMTPTDPTLQTYRDAVAQMQALPMSDPRNWTRQAQIHQNFCPHGNWFFLPWHRAYLLSFERICQELTGERKFGLPYWNWSCNRRIPAPFWESGSPLNHSPRTATSTSTAAEATVGPMTMDTILSETDFELFASGAATALRGGGGFYGAIEGTPHNYIHGFVGGTMGSFMSPLDPVFWTHHNVIDYFWLAWNQRGNANTNDPTYVNFDIAGHMVDGDGNPTTYRVGALILAPLLSYRFEPPASCGPLRFTTLETGALRRLLPHRKGVSGDRRRSAIGRRAVPRAARDSR
jgi:tyrosinase